MMTLELFFALVMLAALVAYALLGCADFGGGIWDLLSSGPRAAEQRRHIARAIGPVWEANHVWLIFLIVVLFTCFPAAYAAASVALFWPLHLILIGIVLRGASFVFRAYGATAVPAQAAWGHIFGAASALTPILLGICVGAVSTGGAPWTRFSIATGALALLLCAYVAAVYLAWETRGDLRDQFRRRALLTWLVAGVVSVLTLAIASFDAPRLFTRLTSGPAGLVLVAGALLAPASLAALWRRHFPAARVLATLQVIVLLGGWGAAQWPYLIFPELTVRQSAAPAATLLLTAITLPIGIVLLVPSLAYLFTVFKGRNPHDQERALRHDTPRH
jgi:cytochrome d ubiquinol oxidase subunit II